MSELPEHWLAVKLLDVCEINPGKPRDRDITSDTQVTFVPMAAVDAGSGQIVKPTTRLFKEVSKGFTAFQENDVIFAKITPCMENGKAAIAKGLINGIGFGSTEFHVLRTNGSVIPEYLFYFIRQESFRKVAETNMTGTVGQKRVPVNFLNETALPLPPLNEQRRIVAKLEKLLSRVEAAQARLAKIPLILKRFRQSVLAAACLGKLTRDWSLKTTERPDLTWQVMEAHAACEAVESGSTPEKTKFQKDKGIPFLKVYNIVQQQIHFESKPQFIDPGTHRSSNKRSVVKPGDVLMNIVGPPLGKVAIVPGTYPEWNINQAIVLFRPKAELLTSFLYHLLCSGLPYSEILMETRGSAGQSNISLSQCRKMQLSVPSLTEQNEIVRRVEALFKTVDILEARYLNTKAHVDNLTQSILALAFQGKLLPQNPNDDPASILMQRTS